VLFLPGKRLLPETGEKLATYTATALQKRGTEIMFETVVHAAGPDWVEVKPRSGGEPKRIDAHTFIWAGGVKPVPAVHASGLPIGQHGGIQADSTCRVFANENVWALGDCAEVPTPNQEGTYAPTAQNAIREGKRVGKNILAVVKGQEPQAFEFTPIGELAVVGTHSGVAVLKGLRIKGRLAWWMWRWIYLAKLPRMSQRMRVAIDWFTDSAFGIDLAQLPAGRGPSSVDVQSELTSAHK
jgi:NADH:quinone reductase (non-electrogenic)